MGKKSKRTGKKKGGAKKENGSAGAPSKNRPLQENSPPAVADESVSLYELYKVATHRFKNGLMALVPSSIFDRDVVADLLDAADWIRDNRVTVEPQLIADLKLAINVRNRYSKNFVDGGDEGHGYFVIVLNYCLSVLKVSCPQVDASNKQSGKEGHDEMTNTFAALAIGDESDDESEEEEEGEVEIKRPEEPTTHYSLTQYLYSIPDTAQANQFLEAISYHTMRAITVFQNLKETMQMVNRGEFDESRVPRELVAAGVMLNMAIANVKHLEDSLAVECPHLNSPYRILACAYMAPPINLIGDVVRQHSPVARNFKDTMALGFVSDVIKVVFRGESSNMSSAVSNIADRFSRRWKLDEHWTHKVKWLGQIIARFALKESLTEMERPYLEKYTSLEELGQGGLNYEQAWFEGYESCTGGDRSIINTLKMLDMLASLQFDKDTKNHILNVIPWRMDTWEEDTQPANKIRGDFDGNLVRILMALMDSWRFDKRPVPREKELLPFVSLFRSWSLHMEQTPLSVAFAFHLILTSLYEIQGEGDVQRLATASILTFDRFFDQVQAELDSSVPTPNTRKNYLTAKIMSAKKLTEVDPKFLEFPQDSLIVFWNPVCASMFLSYITFGSSLEGGGSSIDDGKQATFVLHLYNALRQRDLVDADLPVVSTIDKYFDKLKPIWNAWTTRPEPCKFVYRLFLSMGADHSFASYMQEMARYRELGGDGDPPEKPKGSLSDMLYRSRNRSSSYINPADFSLCYNRVCLNDFAGSESEWLPAHLQRDPRRDHPANLQEHEIRVFHAITPMQKENDLIHLNLIVVGGLFNEFICQLFPPLGTDGISMPSELKTIRQELYSQESPLPKNSSFYEDEDNARVVYTIQLLEYVLGRLDYADAEEYEYMGRHFEKFFRALDPDKVKILS